MTHAQPTTTSARPWHLWVVGILGGLWSLMGIASFCITQMNVESVMGGFPPEQRAYFLSFPLWADGLWGLGVFAGVIGCILLLLRKRVAFHVLVVSAIGAIASNLGGLFLLGGWDVMSKTGGLGFTAVPIVFSLFMATYAGAVSKKGVLR
jgi:hypothetical protein